MNYLQDFNWRYATKRMNGKPVPADQLNNILEATRLAPSSLGLQPFDVLVIQDPELRANLSPAIYNQPQVTEGSALLVFAAWKNVAPWQIDQYLENIASTRNIPLESLNDFRKMIVGSITTRTDEQVHQWAARQAYIALGYATAAASFEKVDSTPMEGFNAAAVNEVLDLDGKGLSAVAVLALGYRDEENDHLANAPKVRRPASSFFTVYKGS
jgi:nitroreductase/dihydropteridine reductase